MDLIANLFFHGTHFKNLLKFFERKRECTPAVDREERQKTKQALYRQCRA